MKKKQNRNRLLSLVLSLVMILQMLPVSVLAADATSGTCGPNLTWRIDGDTLFIESRYEYSICTTLILIKMRFIILFLNFPAKLV